MVLQAVLPVKIDGIESKVVLKHIVIYENTGKKQRKDF